MPHAWYSRRHHQLIKDGPVVYYDATGLPATIASVVTVVRIDGENRIATDVSEEARNDEYKWSDKFYLGSFEFEIGGQKTVPAYSVQLVEDSK